MRGPLALISLVALLAACGGSNRDLDADLGGGTTREDASQNAFGLPAPTLTDLERRRFEIGDSFFTKNWVTAPASTDIRDGLGPLFNAQACSSCHVLDGRGLVPEGDDGRLGLLIRLSIPGAGDAGAPVPEPTYGGQLQDRAVLDVAAEGRVSITYTEVEGTFGDGTAFTLRRPHYELVDLAFGDLAPGTMLGPRLAPQIVGMGLLEAVPESEVLARADADDADGDGISGRPNLVADLVSGSTRLGRFGWKANQPSVEQQVADAFHGDIGITSSLHPNQECTQAQAECRHAISGGEPEIDDERLSAVVFYARTLSVPAMRDVDDPEVLSGSEVFDDLGCSSCHVTTMRTGTSEIASLSEQTIHPYTDLLLHDLGAGLADGRPDFLASGNEWRTPPLWGLGLVDDVNGERFLLHDGRARTFEEAILWHGGEAETSRERFRLATAAARSALLHFLESL